MKRETEIELIKELLVLDDRKSAFLDDSVMTNPAENYFNAERFSQEREKIFKTMPQPTVHSSELPEPGSFLRRDFAGLPILFTRDTEGNAYAFLNVCRHRGTRLVNDTQGCKKRFTCPYHAWTWNNRGELISVPHREQGFPDLDFDTMGLKRLGCIERYGWIWVWACSEEAPNVDNALGEIAKDLQWLGPDSHQILHSDEKVRSVNWKILAEGGLEAYHFRVAHRDTIAPFFYDNLSTYKRFGPHLRSILPKLSLREITNTPTETWRLRDHTQILYTIFPTSQFLVQSDHISWLHFEPLSATATRVRLSTLVPNHRMESDEDLEHWAKNHEITLATLTEDFDIGESIQAGLESGTNQHLTFGRFEGALAEFNRIVESRL